MNEVELASNIRAVVADINNQLDTLAELYWTARNSKINIQLENGINGEVDLKVDGVKPYKLRLLSIKKEVEL